MAEQKYKVISLATYWTYGLELVNNYSMLETMGNRTLCQAQKLREALIEKGHHPNSLVIRYDDA
jgi:hypothetical protein